MLNRDPDFLPMQQQIQRKLMDDYHRKKEQQTLNTSERQNSEN